MLLINGWDVFLCIGIELLKNFFSFNVFVVVFLIFILLFIVDIILMLNWGCESVILIVVVLFILGLVLIIMGIDILLFLYFIIIKV